MFDIEYKVRELLKKYANPVKNTNNEDEKKEKEKNTVTVTLTSAEKNTNEENMEKSDKNESAKTTENEDLSRDNLLDSIKKLNGKLSGVVTGDDGSLDLKKKTYVAPTDEEIEADAKKYADEKYDPQKTILSEEKFNEIKALELTADKRKTEGDISKQNIDNSYGEAIDGVSKQAIKRGIARSSIILQQIAELNKEKIKDYLNIDDKTASDIAEINCKISSVESEYSTAIKGLDVEKAVKMREKIEELKKLREDKLNEVLEYNNKIEEKLTNYADKQKEKNNSENVNISDDEKMRLRRLRLSAALRYYQSLDAIKAYNDFNSDLEMQSALGEDALTVKRYLENAYKVAKQ